MRSCLLFKWGLYQCIYIYISTYSYMHLYIYIYIYIIYTYTTNGPSNMARLSVGGTFQRESSEVVVLSPSPSGVFGWRA